MNAEILLSRVADISQKHELIAQKTGKQFNLFEIAGIANDEVRMCRVLYELLNPQGCHFQGDLYLRLFFKNVLHLDLDEEEYQTAKVFREYYLPNGKRIDLVIKTYNRFIPIEVKIHAEDQPKQCFDYFQNAENSDVYYLTLDGHLPSSDSAMGLTPVYSDDKEIVRYQGVTTVSFEDELLDWVNECLEQRETIETPPIREILLQFSQTIRILTNHLEEGKEMEITQLISSSKENMKSAFEVESGLQVCKTQMLEKILKTLEKRINMEKLENQYDYEKNQEKLVRSYYNHKNSTTCPGISYRYQEQIKPGTDLWFRIEIDVCLYAGFCVVTDGKLDEQGLVEEQVKKRLPHLCPCSDRWWVYWEYLPDNDEDSAADFNEFNKEYLNLFDQGYFDQFIDKCMERIHFLLQK
jgi:hypothetical protein